MQRQKNEYIRHMDTSEALKHIANVRIYYKHMPPYLEKALKVVEDKIKELGEIHGD